MLPAATREVWKGLTQERTAEPLRAFETPQFLVFTFTLEKNKKIEAKAEEFVAICFGNVYFHFSCQDCVPKSIAHLFMRKCAFSLRVEVLDK